jgi:hypothetical protein
MDPAEAEMFLFVPPFANGRTPETELVKLTGAIKSSDQLVDKPLSCFWYMEPVLERM